MESANLILRAQETAQETGPGLQFRNGRCFECTSRSFELNFPLAVSFDDDDGGDDGRGGRSHLWQPREREICMYITSSPIQITYVGSTFSRAFTRDPRAAIWVSGLAANLVNMINQAGFPGPQMGMARCALLLVTQSV
ncbi:hypothetical protein HN011_000051 [Eciton burchellii]|nr:hypothetical protein HN011_000051 [Eciton burchellii]